MKQLKVFFISLLMVVATSQASAFGLKDAIRAKTGINLGGNDGATVAAAFIVSSKSINKAQIHLAKAFELNELAASLELQAQALSGGSLSTKALKKYTQLSKEADAAINAKITEGAELTAAGKAEYRKAILPYSVGLASLLVAVKNAKGMSNGVDLGSLYVIKELPGYTKRLSGTSKLMLSYSKTHQIEESSNAEEKMGELE